MKERRAIAGRAEDYFVFGPPFDTAVIPDGAKRRSGISRFSDVQLTS
jgi:hypothetical protein